MTLHNGPFVFSFLGTVSVTMSFYWMTAMIFMLMDYTQRPKFLMKYKMQQGKNAPPDTAKVIKVNNNAALNNADKINFIRQRLFLKLNHPI